MNIVGKFLYWRYQENMKRKWTKSHKTAVKYAIKEIIREKGSGDEEKHYGCYHPEYTIAYIEAAVILGICFEISQKGLRLFLCKRRRLKDYPKAIKFALGYKKEIRDEELKKNRSNY